MGFFGKTMEEIHEENRLKLMIIRIVQEEIRNYTSSAIFRLMVQDIIKNELNFSNIRIEIQNDLEDQIIREIKKQFKLR